MEKCVSRSSLPRPGIPYRQHPRCGPKNTRPLGFSDWVVKASVARLPRAYGQVTKGSNGGPPGTTGFQIVAQGSLSLDYAAGGETDRSANIVASKLALVARKGLALKSLSRDLLAFSSLFSSYA